MSRPLSPPRGDRLSPRERDIVVQLAEGLSDQEIAERLGIARRTVSTHLASVYIKLGVSNRLSALVESQRRGLVPVSVSL